jgi:hypothetical protein
LKTGFPFGKVLERLTFSSAPFTEIVAEFPPAAVPDDDPTVLKAPGAGAASEPELVAELDAEPWPLAAGLTCCTNGSLLVKRVSETCPGDNREL